MTEQEINNLIDSKIGKTKMSQLPEATQTSGLYSIGYTGNQSVKYKANLLQGDPLTVRKTYQTEVEALADKNPIDPITSLPLTVGQFVSIVDDGEKNGIYRIGSISGDGTMSLELQGKLGDLSEYVKKVEVSESLKYKTNRTKLLEDVGYAGLIDAFYGTEGSKGVECKGAQLTKSSGYVAISFGNDGAATYTSTIKEGVELIRLQRHSNYFFVLIDWDLITHVSVVSTDSFVLDTPVTTDLKDWHKMLMSSDYAVKDVTTFQYEMPQVYSCTWADGVEGIITLSNFDGNVLEFRNKKATYKDLTITYGTITYDDLGYIKSQGITTINK